MIKFSNLALRRSSHLLFGDASFQVHPGQKIGITGANGCGKSSLFALLRGQLSADSGEVHFPAGWTVAWVAQETELDTQVALDYVIDGDVELRQVEQRLARAESEQDSNLIAACHERLRDIEGYQATSRAARLLAGLGFAEADIRLPLNRFSGGWIMRLNLARALMCRSDLLLLDEPTNHLDLDAVIWLEQWLQRYPGTLMLISHDREFLDSVVSAIAHIEEQQISLYRGNYSAFELQRAERLAQQQAAYRKQQQSIAHMQTYIDRFRAKATKARQAQSRLKALQRMQLIAPAHVDSPFRFEFPRPRALPSSLLKLEQASVGYDGTAILSQIDFSLIPGERIGLLGLNGAGKSTFIRLLAGELEAQSGSVVRAKELQIGYFAQHQVTQLDLDANALVSLQRLEPDLSEREIRHYLGGFDFSGDRVLQRLDTFSGGEKARLVLALLIWQRPNLLLLDEPTNHLDLEMRLALNQALQGFDGSVLLVSHDRHLLRSVCDDLWLVDAGAVQQFTSDLDGYPEWLARRKAGSTTDKPTNERNSQADRRQARAWSVRINRLEKKIERLSAAGRELEQALADNSLYETDSRQRLDEALAAQASNREKLEAAECEWLELSELMERGGD